MPFHVVKIKKGFKVQDDKGNFYSKRLLTKKKAIAQQKALYTSESRSEHFSGAGFASWRDDDGHHIILQGNGFFTDLFSKIRNIGTNIIGSFTAPTLSNAGNIISKGIREDYPPKVRQVLEQYGNANVIKLNVIREPIKKFIDYALNIISLGRWGEAKKRLNYDKLFHLYMIATLQLANGDMGYLKIEKNEVINITPDLGTRSQDAEYETVPVPCCLTVFEMMNNTREAVGPAMFRYEAFNNNCQIFLLNILKANDLDTGHISAFINQSVENLIQELPQYVRPFANLTTNIAGLANRVLYGRGGDQDINPETGYTPIQQRFIDRETTEEDKEARRKQFRDYNKQFLHTVEIQPVFGEVNRDDIIGSFDNEGENRDYMEGLLSDWKKSGKKDFKEYYYGSNPMISFAPGDADTPSSASGSPAVSAQQSSINGAWTIRYADGTKETTRARNLKKYSGNSDNPYEELGKLQDMTAAEADRMKKRQQEQRDKRSGADKFFDSVNDTLIGVADVANTFLPINPIASNAYDAFRPQTTSERDEGQVQSFTNDYFNKSLENARTLGEEENKLFRGRLSGLVKHDESLQQRLQNEQEHGTVMNQFVNSLQGEGRGSGYWDTIARQVKEWSEGKKVQGPTPEEMQDIYNESLTGILSTAKPRGEVAPGSKTALEQVADQASTAADIADKIPGLGTASKVLQGVDLINQLAQGSRDVLRNTAEQYAPGASSNAALKSNFGILGFGKLKGKGRYKDTLNQMGYKFIRIYEALGPFYDIDTFTELMNLIVGDTRRAEDQLNQYYNNRARKDEILNNYINNNYENILGDLVNIPKEVVLAQYGNNLEGITNQTARAGIIALYDYLDAEKARIAAEEHAIAQANPEAYLQRVLNTEPTDGVAFQDYSNPNNIYLVKSNAELDPSDQVSSTVEGQGHTSSRVMPFTPEEAEMFNYLRTVEGFNALSREQKIRVVKEMVYHEKAIAEMEAREAEDPSLIAIIGPDEKIEIAERVSGSGEEVHINPLFKRQLKQLRINPHKYLEAVREIAKGAGYDPSMLYFSDDGSHKLMYLNPDGKKTHFGAVEYNDFLIYKHLEDLGKVQKGYAEQKRRVFTKSHCKIKGDWKKDKYSANNLSIKLLWSGDCTTQA